MNAGVMLMNLTRLRTFPGGWLNENMQAYDKYKQDIVLADQDILNILFNKVSLDYGIITIKIFFDVSFSFLHFKKIIISIFYANSILDFDKISSQT